MRAIRDETSNRSRCTPDSGAVAVSLQDGLLRAVVLAAMILSPSLAYGQEEEPEWVRWEVREDDYVWLVDEDGNLGKKPLVGTLEEARDPSKWRFKSRGGGVGWEFPKSQAGKILWRELPKDVYEARRQTVAAGDLVGHAQLAWNCQQYTDEVMVQGAVTEWREVLRIRPACTWAYRWIVELYDHRWARSSVQFPIDLAEEEAGFWLTAEKAGVKDPRVLHRHGLICRNLGLRLQAGRLFEDAYLGSGSKELTGVRNDCLFEMASILREMGNHADAVKDYRKLIDSEELSERLAYRAQTGLGLASLGAGDFEAAAAAFQAAAELQPENPEPKEFLASVEYSRGNLEEAERLYEEARELYGAAPLARLLVNLALARIRLGHFVAAEGDLAVAEEAEPSDGKIYVVRAYLRLCQRDPETAIAELDRAEEVRPKGAYAAYLRGVALRDSGKGAEALVAFRSALTGGFDAALCLRAMGETHSAMGNAEDAVRYLEYALAGREPTAEERGRLARALLEAGRSKEALGEALAALSLDPALVPAIRLQGYLLYRKGDYAGSQEAFETALRHADDDPYARTALEKVKELADLQVWTEGFDREDGGKVRNRWDESERRGVEIGLREGACVFSGTQSGEGRTRLSRTISKSDASRFVRMEADIEPPVTAGARTGIRLEVGKSGRIVFFVEDGRLQYAYMSRASGDSPWETGEVGEWPEGRHTMGVAVADRKAWTFHLLLDGEIVGELKHVTLMKLSGKEIELVLYGEADEGVSWELKVEEVRIFRTGTKGAKREAPP